MRVNDDDDNTAGLVTHEEERAADFIKYEQDLAWEGEISKHDVDFF